MVAFQGSEAACTIMGTSHGPVTNLGIQICNLPAGVMLLPKAYSLQYGVETSIVLHFTIEPHAEITASGANTLLDVEITSYNKTVY